MVDPAQGGKLSYRISHEKRPTRSAFNKWGTHRAKYTNTVSSHLHTLNHFTWIPHVCLNLIAYILQGRQKTEVRYKETVAKASLSAQGRRLPDWKPVISLSLQQHHYEHQLFSAIYPLLCSWMLPPYHMENNKLICMSNANVYNHPEQNIHCTGGHWCNTCKNCFPRYWLVS